VSAAPAPITGGPFATRRVRPGAVPYFFPDGESAARLVGRLREAGWWGQIVGPHGSGKSTLLAALLPELRRAGRGPLLVVRHRGERALPGEAWEGIREAGRAGRPLVVVLDGWEQLGLWGRFWVRRRCRRGGHGLLVTAHADAGLPELYRTEVTPALALRVLDHLVPGPERTVTAAELLARLAAREGNLREALFDLYDLHERRSKR
jgi:hypothetical protein